MQKFITQKIKGISIFCSLFTLLFLSAMTLMAQTVSTAGGTGYLGNISINNPAPRIASFVVQNTGSTALALTSVSSQMAPGFGGQLAGAVSNNRLYMSTTSLGGNFDVSTAAWTQVATGTSVVPAAPTPGTPAAIVQCITGANIVIPAGAEYRFVLELSAGLVGSTNLVAPNPLPTPSIFTVGDVTLKLGNVALAGGNVGYIGVSPAPAAGNTPFWFGGSVTLIGTVPCAGTPAPGNTFSTVSDVCPNTPFSLSVQNATAGTGVTYQWQSATALAGPYTNIAGATNPTLNVASITANTFYQLRVTCGTSTATSTPVLVGFSNCTCIAPGAATICEGSIQQLSLTTSAAGGGTFGSGTINLVIPDANATGVTTAPIVLPAQTIANANNFSIRVNMTHTWVGDLIVRLTSPCGTSFVFDRPGVPASLFGNSQDLGGVYTFNLAAATIIPEVNTGAATIAPGSFRPSNTPGVAHPWTGLTFPCTAGGNWTLTISDNGGGDLGRLIDWAIVIPPTNTAIFSPVTGLFTDPAATIPYTGTPIVTVFASPATTTTYTATISGGPCAGANTVTVTVLPRPVVSVSPTSACGPVTLTASGAASYAWTPTGGLNMSTGPTVVANPAATTTYSVIGRSNNGCFSAPATATVNSAPTASVISAVAGATFQIQEGFTTVLPAGWARQNLSSPVGPQNWAQGIPAVFPSFNGAPNAYAFNNFNATTGDNTISSWMFTPVVNIKNGDVVSFHTRTQDPAANQGVTYPDRLELRMSTNGASVNAGTTNTSVGDYTNLLLTINPTLTTTGYPFTWTRFTATVSGVTGTVSGRLAFRYFVTNGGFGANSDAIGVDQVEFSTPSTANCANVVTNLTVNITGGVGPYTLVYSNGTTNTTINNYVSGSNIQVSPSATTTYTIVSVTGANTCVGTNNSGSATITITPPAAITTQPVSATVCAGNNATFTVAATPVTGNTFQWQVSVAGGAFTNIAGATSNTFTVTAPTAAMSGNRYRVIVTGVCAPSVTSAIATLTVNTPAVITTQPVARTICASPSTTGNTTTFTVAATGGDLTYQYQVSTDGGTTFTNVVNGANYSGATTNTLTITNPPATFNNYIYRVLVTSGGCTAVTSSNALLTVNPAPVVVLSASPYEALFPGLTTTLTAAVSSGVGSTYTWFLNGVLLPGATGNTISNLGVNNLGTYTVRVGTTNGCSGLSNAKTLRDSASNNLFVYPNPNNGTFEVRFFNDPTSQNANIARNVIIYDSKGARVYSQRAVILGGTYGPMKVNLTNQPAGVYQIDLVDEKGNRLKTGKVVIL